MSGQHSPAPWKLDGYDVYQNRDFTSDQSIVCTVNDEVGGNDAFPDTEMAQSNAYLIAAAPDLFDAVNLYLAAGHKESRRLASIKAKEAIFKAKGNI